MNEPKYPLKPIFSLKALSLFLGESANLLVSLSKRSSNLYRHVPQVKKDGTKRDTYDAFEPLKKVQRKIVDRILARVQFPEYLHGGIRDRLNKRSIYSNARAHGGARQLILQDIQDFFPSIRVEHVYYLFNNLFRFSPDVSKTLALLTTRNGVIPQGASTSSYLANLIFWDIEPEVVAELESRGFHYSRFADDITVSSQQRIGSDEIRRTISTITTMLARKNFVQKRSKLHVRKRGQTINPREEPAPTTVTGLTVYNASPGLAKAERRRIRAAVKEIEIIAETGTQHEALESLIRSALGRIGRMTACSYPEAERLKSRVMRVKEQLQSPSGFSDQELRSDANHSTSPK